MYRVMTQLDDVSFAYEKDPVLKSVSLKIYQGEMVCVIGPNGAGKSTLLKILGGLLYPDSGKVSFKNQNLRQFNKKYLARSMAWVPQEHPQIFPFRVSEIVMMGRHPYLSALTFEDDNDYAIASHAMKLTDTNYLSNRLFNEISGGEKQRVMMASALTQEPEIMLLDEPTAALDLKYQIEILNILRKLNQDHKMTFILAMHDLHLASKYCDRMILMDKGTIVKIGSPDQVLKKELLEKVYGVTLNLFKNDKDGSVMISPVTKWKH